MSIPVYISVRSDGGRSTIVVVLILEKEMLVDAVNSKGDGGGAKARKSALEAFGAGELAGGTPGLAVFGERGVSCWLSKLPPRAQRRNCLYSLLGPRIVFGHTGSSTELADVEPRGVLGDGAENSFVVVRNRKAGTCSHKRGSPCDAHFGDGNCLLTSMREWLHTRSASIGLATSTTLSPHPTCLASATAQCVTGTRTRTTTPNPVLGGRKGPRPLRGEHCNRSWLVRPVKERYVHTCLYLCSWWPVRSTACRLGASNLPFNTATGTGAVERTCPPETSQIATAVDSLRPCTRYTNAQHSTSFRPVRRNLSTRTTELNILNFPGCTPPYSFPSTAVVPIVCHPPRRYYPAHIGRFHRRLSARPPLRHPSEQRLVRNGAYTARPSKTNFHKSDITIDV